MLRGEIADAIAGPLQQLEQIGAAMTPIPRLLVVDQRRAPSLSRHEAINTAPADAAPHLYKGARACTSPTPSYPWPASFRPPTSSNGTAGEEDVGGRDKPGHGVMRSG